MQLEKTPKNHLLPHATTLPSLFNFFTTLLRITHYYGQDLLDRTRKT